MKHLYRFGTPHRHIDRRGMPHIKFSIQQDMNKGRGRRWRTIGYIENHLHKVKIDQTDIVDISIGHTGRINFKR